MRSNSTKEELSDPETEMAIINAKIYHAVMSSAAAQVIAEQIRSTLSEPYQLTLRREGESASTVTHRCTVSIGIALFIDHQSSLEDILKWADMAMYQAKERGVPVTNYGIAIACVQGVLPRVLSPFPSAFAAFQQESLRLSSRIK